MSPESTAECHPGDCRALGAPEVGAGEKGVALTDLGSSGLLREDLRLLCPVIILALLASSRPSSLAAAPP